MFLLPNTTGYVYYTNKLSHQIKELPKNDKIVYVKLPFTENIIKPIIKDLTPYNYQNEATNKINNYFLENNRGILSMPCGTGKTYITYMSALKYKQIIIISPLKQFTKQNLDKFIEYGYSNKTLLVSSDGERNIPSIKNFIESNQEFLISCTYDSVDVISEVIQYFKDPFIIIDEFHNLSKNNICDKENPINKLLNYDYKILFVSATPRIYDMETLNEDYDSEQIFGNVIYNMTFTHAIENKYICDYKIWLPSIHEDNSKLLKELSIYEIDDTIKAKLIFLLSCILNNGSRKCIIYCVDTQELKDLIEGLDKVNDFYCLDFDVYSITCSTSEVSRADILNNFSGKTKIQLLFSIRILDECIDIPSCDSVFITYPSQSKIRSIQRLSRCIRNNSNNKFKIGNIYIWCDEYEKILNTLSGIKEYDSLFTNKIKVSSIDFYNNTNVDIKEQDTKLISNYIVNIKEFKQILWKEKLELVSKYIDDNKKRPTSHNQDKYTNHLTIWLSNQIANYKNNIQQMKDKKNRKLFELFLEKYKEYFLDNNSSWYSTLQKIKTYIDENNKRPSCEDKNAEIKSLGTWLFTQSSNYQKKSQIMKDEIIRQEYENFIKEYKKYFLTSEEKWYENLTILKDYIETNKQKPAQKNKDINVRYIASWLRHQELYYDKKDNIMKIDKFRLEFEKFQNEYKPYFVKPEEEWDNNLKSVKEYINKNNKRPSSSDKDKNTKRLGLWVNHQELNYRENINNMKKEDIKNKYESFRNEYIKYFLTNEEIWKNNLKSVISYIDINQEKPSYANMNNKEIKALAQWIDDQKKIYKQDIQIMKNQEIKTIYEDFISEYEEYL